MEPLTTTRLNRAVLARQLLLERSDLTPAAAAAQVCGLQTQYAPSGYIGLWSRLRSFDRPTLTGALLAGEVIQAWAMRCTIHMVAAADHPVFTEAVREPRRDWYLRAARIPAGTDMAAVAAAVAGYLADGPLKQAEIQRRMAEDGFPRELWPGVQLWVDLIRSPEAGTWDKPRAHVYALAASSPSLDRDAAREALVRRYLGAFGPAAVKDIATFCGWNITVTRAILRRLDVREFVDEAGTGLFDLPDAPLPDAGTPAPVRFLGQWDAVLLGHAKRAQILPDAFRPRVFATTMPQSVRTFLVDGRVAGTWSYDGDGGAVRWEPFEPLDAAASRAVDAEAARLTAFHA